MPVIQALRMSGLEAIAMLRVRARGKVSPELFRNVSAQVVHTSGGTPSEQYSASEQTDSQAGFADWFDQHILGEPSTWDLSEDFTWSDVGILISDILHWLESPFIHIGPYPFSWGQAVGLVSTVLSFGVGGVIAASVGGVEALAALVVELLPWLASIFESAGAWVAAPLVGGVVLSAIVTAVVIVAIIVIIVAIYWDSISAAFGDFFDAVDAAWDWICDAAESVWDAVCAAVEAIVDFFSGSSSSSGGSTSGKANGILNGCGHPHPAPPPPRVVDSSYLLTEEAYVLAALGSVVRGEASVYGLQTLEAALAQHMVRWTGH